MRDLGRRFDGGGSGRAAGDVANQLAPGRVTLVEALDVSPLAAPRSTVDAVSTTAQPDQQSAITDASAPNAATPATGSLSPAEVAAAIQFHTAQPWKYTKAVITDIQAGVGVTSTGVMNAATVQAIAARQATVNADRKPTPPLKVDGKAGPRTLPILKPVGLATDEVLDSYVADVGGMKKELDKATPAERAELLMKELNKQLDAVGVPPITKPVAIAPHGGTFASETWTMTMSLAILAKPKEAAASLYHEGRHAEQAFRVARMRAGKKQSAARIARDVPIEASIAAKAVTLPLAPGTTEAVEAEGWDEDEVGRPTRAQLAAKDKAVIDKFFAAGRAYKKDPSPANHARASAAYEEWKNSYYIHGYRDRPPEYDAFFVGEKVADKLGSPRESFLPLDAALAQF